MNQSSKVIESGRYLLPNLMTTFNLVCGLLAIIVALEPLERSGTWFNLSNHALACWLVMSAMVFDFLDGKVARWTRGFSDFGVRIDSLTDFISFGAAPGIIAFTSILASVPVLVRALVFGAYLSAGAWRLARFNTQTRMTAPTSYFSGLPIPAAAAFLSALVLVAPGSPNAVPRFVGRSFNALTPGLAGAVFVFIILVLSGLMVSRIPFAAFKRISFRNLLVFSGIGIFALVLLLILPLANIIFLIMLLYIVIGLFQVFVNRVLQLQEKSDGAPGDAKRSEHG